MKHKGTTTSTTRERNPTGKGETEFVREKEVRGLNKVKGVLLKERRDGDTVDDMYVPIII